MSVYTGEMFKLDWFNGFYTAQSVESDSMFLITPDLKSVTEYLADGDMKNGIMYVTKPFITHACQDSNMGDDTRQFMEDHPEFSSLVLK